MITNISMLEASKATFQKISTTSTFSTLALTSDDSAFKQIANNIKELNDNIGKSFDNIKSVFDFFGKVGDFFKEASYWITHPGQLLDAFQPWFMIALMIMIILRMLGFNTDKWFRLCFLLLILSLIF